MNLKLNELVQLNMELFGIGRTEGEKKVVILEGLLKTVSSQKLKMILHRIAKMTEEETKKFEELRLELYKKYGEEKDGVINVPTDKQEELIKELSDLEGTDKEVDTKPFWGETDVQKLLENENTSEYYPMFYKLIGV